MLYLSTSEWLSYCQITKNINEEKRFTFLFPWLRVMCNPPLKANYCMMVIKNIGTIYKFMVSKS